MILGVYLLVRSIQRFGIAPQDTFIKRCLIFGGGVLPHYVLSLSYTLMNAPWNALQGVLAIFIAAGLAVLVAGLSLRVPQLTPEKSIAVEGRHVVYAVTLGLMAIGVPYLFFSS